MGWWDESPADETSTESAPARPFDTSKLQLTLEGIVAQHRGGEVYDGWGIGEQGTAVGARLDFRYRVFSRLSLGIEAEYLHVAGPETTRHLFVPLVVSFGIVRGVSLELDATLAVGYTQSWIDSAWADGGTLQGRGTSVELRVEGAVRVDDQLWVTMSAGARGWVTGVDNWSKDAEAQMPGTLFTAIPLGLGARWRW